MRRSVRTLVILGALTGIGGGFVWADDAQKAPRLRWEALRYELTADRLAAEREAQVLEGHVEVVVLEQGVRLGVVRAARVTRRGTEVVIEGPFEVDLTEEGAARLREAAGRAKAAQSLGPLGGARRLTAARAAIDTDRARARLEDVVVGGGGEAGSELRLRVLELSRGASGQLEVGGGDGR